MWENEGKCAGVTSPYRRREKKGRGRIPRVTGKTLADFFFFARFLRIFLKDNGRKPPKKGWDWEVQDLLAVLRGLLYAKAAITPAQL